MDVQSLWIEHIRRPEYSHALAVTGISVDGQRPGPKSIRPLQNVARGGLEHGMQASTIFFSICSRNAPLDVCQQSYIRMRVELEEPCRRLRDNEQTMIHSTLEGARSRRRSSAKPK
ncbi:predicted protein [Histoplasma capsulatum H143]|uniref:Uncharacterized protein n=1 Tax=Ajellomyces capsulatus (strain H143) TaxID=544712 RepID=C6HQS8_AJECH|nr:predicted protein [Histoplasma capsulatum H143]